MEPGGDEAWREGEASRYPATVAEVRGRWRSEEQLQLQHLVTR